jgi:O-antigen/teichoic acid export membrane protein
MAVDVQQAPTGRRQLGGRAAGAIVDQFVVAGTSFVLMILVRRKIGAAALGEYAVLINAMILITSMQTAWVGDSLTVLNRFERRVRGALIASQCGFIVLAVTAGSLMVGSVEDTRGALLFGGMTALWITEEVGRRIFMARQEFWQLVLNDVIYGAGAFVGIAMLRVLVGRYSVTLVVGAMAIGAGVSILAAFVQLPRKEVRLARPTASAVREMAQFGSWRSAQMGIRPLAMFVVRLLVIVFATKTVLGNLEGARLFSQPAMTYVSGVASFLLPLYIEDERRAKRSVPIVLTTALLVLPVALYGAAVLVLKAPIAHILLSKNAHVSNTALLGWLMFALMFAAGQPVANLLIARKLSRQIFWVRAADSTIGLAVAIPLIKVVSPDLAPWALSGGMVIGTIALAVLAVRSTQRQQRIATAVAQAVG